MVHALKPDRGIGVTAIDKRAVTGPVKVSKIGLYADVQADRVHHGGHDQAIYAYSERRGAALGPVSWAARSPGGFFGENLRVPARNLGRHRGRALADRQGRSRGGHAAAHAVLDLRQARGGGRLGLPLHRTRRRRLLPQGRPGRQDPGRRRHRGRFPARARGQRAGRLHGAHPGAGAGHARRNRRRRVSRFRKRSSRKLRQLGFTD